MATTECPNGHLYDTNLYASCPYCRSTANMIDFEQAGGVAAPGGYNATVAPGGYNATVAPGWQTPEPYRMSPADEVGKTVAPESYLKKVEEENKTVAAYQKKFEMDPVVGWLVCVSGADKGKSFELYARINTIGRSSTNDICIRSDSTISREHHARLAYDSRHNSYQLLPGESTNNIYLNDEPVYTHEKLEAYDVVELGESKFLFIPLCGERFNWEHTV